MEEITIQVGLPGGQSVDAVVDDKLIHTDQPVKDGGDDSGPSPFDLFLGSIATCAGYYALAFCQRRKIPTDNLRLTVKCIPDESKKRLGRIVTEIAPPPDFPEKYKAALVRAVDLCTVKKHIVAPPEFDVQIV